MQYNRYRLAKRTLPPTPPAPSTANGRTKLSPATVDNAGAAKTSKQLTLGSRKWHLNPSGRVCGGEPGAYAQYIWGDHRMIFRMVRARDSRHR